MAIEIKNRWTNAVIKTVEAENLRNANLRNADLRGADLRSANFQNADLRNANLSGADLSGADLSGADLRNANLSGADLRNANLSGANLRNADLRDATLPYYELPEGELIGYKICAAKLVKILIPREAKRTACLVSRKCRADMCLTLSTETGDSVKSSIRAYEFMAIEYIPGEMQYSPNGYCDDIRIECAAGIHFFLTEREARDFWKSLM